MRLANCAIAIALPRGQPRGHGATRTRVGRSASGRERGVAGERLPGRARVLRMPVFTSFQSDRRGSRRGSDKAVAQWRLAVMVLTLVLVLA